MEADTMKAQRSFSAHHAWVGLLVVLAVAGFAAWVYQWRVGLSTTGMSNAISWGLYIVTFAFLVGLSAGGLIVSSLAYILKNERLHQVAPLGVIVAVACVVGAMAIIIPDVGHPERIIEILVRPNFASPLTWDILILTVYLAIGLVEAWLLFSRRADAAEAERKDRVLRGLAYLVLPVAILVHSVTAWIFGIQVGRPFWFTGLMAPIFISSALVSGLGLLVLVMLAVRRTGRMTIGRGQFTFLGSLLAAFIALDFFLLASELLTISYARGVEAFAIVREMMLGSYAPFFWVEILLGVALPFLLLVLPATRRSPAWIGLASFLAMAGVFLKRINIILPSFSQLNVPFAPGVALGRYDATLSPFTMQPTYTPTLVEVAITLGVLAGVLLIITLGVRLATTVPQRQEVPVLVAEANPA
jgi:dimethyl sulfoxide reductase membrane subunit